MLRIRAARVEDLKAVQRLYCELHREMAQLQPDNIRAVEQDLESLARLLERPERVLLVAELDGKVLGFALVAEQQPPLLDWIVPHRYGYLMDLAVDSGARGAWGWGPACCKVPRNGRAHGGWIIWNLQWLRETVPSGSTGGWVLATVSTGSAVRWNRRKIASKPGSKQLRSGLRSGPVRLRLCPHTGKMRGSRMVGNLQLPNPLKGYSGWDMLA